MSTHYPAHPSSHLPKCAWRACALIRLVGALSLGLLLVGCDSKDTEIKPPVRPVKVVVVEQNQQGETL